MEGNAGFASLYWPQLEKWAEYLKAKGFDPENQLCTDDFAGHLAHNVNLSAKAICGLGSFAKLCQMRGEQARADEYFELARGFAQRWVKEADDGEKYRLAFDRPGTWSQKYNLIWDRILDLNLFPADVARKEMAYYKKNQNTYGLPLDNRKPYTKLDWILWTATLTRDRADFEALVGPVYRFLNETPDRSPMTDWYQTRDAKKVGFTARPVVGGVFAQMLYEQAAWKKYAGRDQTKAAKWASLPELPKLKTVVPAADVQPAVWRYTTSRPATNWSQPSFDCSSWAQGKSGFGTPFTPGAGGRDHLEHAGHLVEARSRAKRNRLPRPPGVDPSRRNGRGLCQRRARPSSRRFFHLLRLVGLQRPRQTRFQTRQERDRGSLQSNRWRPIH